METELRAVLLDWLRSDLPLKEKLNTVAEEAPQRAAIPWLGIAASASIDWSTKEHKGREVRIAMELHLRGDDPATGSATVAQVEQRIESVPRHQHSFAIISVQFLRARAEQRPANVRAVLLEYRFRVIETSSVPE